METKPITLRPLHLEDQGQMLEILTSNLVNKTYMLPDFETSEAAIPLFNRLMMLSNDTQRFVRCIALDDTAIGFLNDVEIKDGFIELGYVIHPAYHNRGFMTAALNTAIKELFRLGYQTVHCGAFKENAASIRVMEKAGMVRISKTEDIEYRGKLRHCVFYEKRNEEALC